MTRPARVRFLYRWGTAAAVRGLARDYSMAGFGAGYPPVSLEVAGVAGVAGVAEYGKFAKRSGGNFKSSGGRHNIRRFAGPSLEGGLDVILRLRVARDDAMLNPRKPGLQNESIV